MYEVKTDELLGEIHCHATYAPNDLEELKRLYAALSPNGKAKLRQGYEAIGRLIAYFDESKCDVIPFREGER